MKKVIVDSNIIFSSLRSQNSKARRILELDTFKYYAPNFLIVEIFKHKEKILHFSKADESEVYEFLNLDLHFIYFINEEFVSTENLIHAFRLCKDVDKNDIPFVALALELNCELWTRDKKLKTVLLENGFDQFFDEHQFDKTDI